jgi:ketosteroid isomerase-like protein
LIGGVGGAILTAMRSLVVVMMMAAVAIAEPGPGAKTPKACIDAFNAAASAKDVAALAKLITEPSASVMVKMFGAISSLSVSSKKLVDAVDAKWGAGTAKKIGLEPIAFDLSDMKIDAPDIKETGDTAIASGKGTYYFKKTKGGWLMDPMQEAGAEEKMKEIAVTTESLLKMNVKFQALASDVTAGKVANTQELAKRIAALTSG